jgi:hypothetical protein
MSRFSSASPAAAVVAAMLLSMSAPTQAQEATRFLGGEVSFDDERMHVRLTTSAPVGEPRVSSEPGTLRLRFSDATGEADLDVPGDGGALRFVRVRRGVGDATVVILRFPDGRRVPERAVHVEIEGTTVDVAIPRSRLGEPVLPEPAVAATTPVAPEPVAEPAPSPEAAAPAEPLIAPAEPLFIGGRSAPAPLGTPTGGGWASGRTGLMLLLTLVSGLALALFSWLRRRSSKNAKAAPIAVVASHRLSPKHQLVVVRALGQDHLLSIDGTKTERLASMPSPAREAEPGGAERASQPDFGAHLSDLLGAGGSAEAMRTFAPPAPVATAHAGAMAYASAPMLSTPPSASASEAVQGLLRLRARALR